MKKIIGALALAVGAGAAYGQTTPQDLGQIHGNFQTDIQYYLPDSAIPGVIVPNEKILMNGFANLIYTKGPFSAGIRYESYLNALQGFDKRYQGNGIPYRFATYTRGDLEVTVGNYYEQFGNGLIFRSYEERGLGLDNAMDGVRLKYKPFRGVYLKGVYGKQRLFFAQGPGIMRGGDAEIQLNELIGGEYNPDAFRVTIGGSVLSKFEPDLDPVYVFPENVTAGAGRISVSKGNFTIQGEYAQKINDPSALNRFIYKNGQALLIGANYSQKGFGFNASAKMVDNMDFRSDRAASGNVSTLNFLPPIAKQHTYLLTAFYPYATQNLGEMGAQAEVFYKFKKGSVLGGKYGTEIALNFSKIHGLDSVRTSSYEGYRAKFGAFGKQLYFQDINVEVTKKFSKHFKSVFTFANIKYNMEVIQGLGGKGTLNTWLGVADLTYYINDKYSIRTELHNMTVEGNHDRGSWAAALVEFSVAPKWFISVIDQYNYGNLDKTLRLHYLLGQLTFVKDANRFALSYGRQREGILCVGGVCRQVPGIYGLTLSITSSF
ncbi:MAG: DUF6029 family protein [Bacteroidota bacterium]